jgi:hypothetical protein
MQFDAHDHFLVSRRRTLKSLAAFAIPVGFLGVARGAFCQAADKAKAHDLTCEASPAEYRRVKTVVESSGNLLVRPVVAAVNGKMVNQDQAPLRKVAFAVNVTQVYDERLLAFAEGAAKSLRYYRDVEGTLTIAKQVSKPNIATDRRWICAKLDAEGRGYFSPLEPLKRDELDLVDVPGNPLALNLLSPGKLVNIGDTWTHENGVLESLLGIDKVIEQKAVQSKLTEVKDGVALITLTGGLVGSIQSVKTELQLQAKYNIDLKLKQVTWLAIGLTERRDVSPAQPGYESTTRIRLATMPIGAPAELADEHKDRMKLDDAEVAKLLTFESEKGGFRFLHDSRWYNMVDRVDGSVLRLVDRGDLVAQCTITDLPSLSAGQQTSLGTFQEDVKKKLGKSFLAIQEANESTTETGLTLQRVVASAAAEEVAVTWIYYLAIREDGRRAAIMITHDSSMAERFGAADVTIASSLQFLERSTGAAAATASPQKTSSLPAKTNAATIK